MGDNMVIIDAYRGGNDIGYTNGDVIEKDFNLMISKYIKERLDELGIENILTRDSDIYLSDIDRANIINNYSGIAISNRLNYGDENGVEIEYSLKNSSNLSDKIGNAFNERDIYVNKIYQRRDENDTSKDYDDLLKNTKVETIVIDYGYINNNDDISNVISNHIRYAESVVKGIADYYGKNYNYNLGNEYIIKKGDTLYSIAKQYNLTVNELKEYNNLKSNTLKIGGVLKIPTKSDEASPYSYYIVQKGDSLWSISRKFNTTVDKLKSINNISSNLLSIGQKLKLPSSNTYTVQKGDTLYSISKKYNISLNDLKNKNNLKNNIISIGQVLFI